VSKKGFARTSRGCVKVLARREFAWISFIDMAVFVMLGLLTPFV
jgi:hypothetical protein